MEKEQLLNYTRLIMDWTVKITKPWKKSESVANDYTQDYARGLNDCIKEITKNHQNLRKDFMVKMSSYAWPYDEVNEAVHKP